MLNIDPALQVKNRLPNNINDELHFYRAKIYSNNKWGDDRIQVRIIPFMNDITETSILPKYPPLIQGKVIRGFTEADDGKEKADTVLILATSDFTYGYVVDLLNNMPGINKEPLQKSWNYSAVKQRLSSSGAIIDNFDYSSIYVDIQNNSNTYIEFHDINTGAKWMITEKGDTFMIAPGHVYISARSGPDSGDQVSFIDMTPSHIKIQSNVIDMKAKSIFLGHGNMHVLGTLSNQPVSVEGEPLKPSTIVYM